MSIGNCLSNPLKCIIENGDDTFLLVERREGDLNIFNLFFIDGCKYSPLISANLILFRKQNIE